MIPSKTKLTEFKSKTFQFSKCANASIYMLLFFKTFIPLMGDKHHSHPVILGVIRNLFRVYTIYNTIQNLSRILSHLYRVHPSGVPRATKRCNALDEKNERPFIYRSYTILVLDHAVFSAFIHK